ncbi:MAG: class I SAM-dependent methyltransferase [Pyrinomonadaceae bacterium]
MKPDHDAYGQYLLAQFNALSSGDEAVPEIVERDDNYVDFGSDPGMYFSGFEDWSETERLMIGKARGAILDIGCGAGRHSLYLQEKGLDVTGIDNSPGAVEVCRLRGLKKALIRSIEEIDKFGPDTFETILMLGNNFGLLGSAENAGLILEKMHRITRSNAWIIVKTINPYLTADEAHLKYQKRNKELGRMTGQIRLRVRYGIYVGEWFDYLFVSPEEMKTILIDTGWRLKELFDADQVSYFAVLEKRD